MADAAAAFGFGTALARPLGALLALGLAWLLLALGTLLVTAHGSVRAAAAAVARTATCGRGSGCGGRRRAVAAAPAAAGPAAGPGAAAPAGYRASYEL